jgi:hypothetical protein
MKISKLLAVILAFTAFAVFCIFEGSDLMLNIGATVLIITSFALAGMYVKYSKLERITPPNLCPKCKDGVMCELRSLSVKMCNSCGHNVPWKLKEGQIPLIANNRQVKKK